MEPKAPVIFVVDDDKSVRESLARLLTSVGMKVELFPTAQAFLSSRRPDTPGCVVLDVRGVERHDRVCIGSPIRQAGIRKGRIRRAGQFCAVPVYAIAGGSNVVRSRGLYQHRGRVSENDRPA